MSVKLSCSALGCVQNMSGLCGANSIEIFVSNAHCSAATQCNTFSEKGLKNAITNMVNMNVVGEVKQIFTESSIEMSPKIECEAVACRYNDNKLCCATNIQIIGSSTEGKEDTQCETFTE